MVGLATGLIGMSLINPLSLLAGVLVGRRAYREDMNTRLSRRQHEAKLLVRRYIDEVVFQVGKQLKDRLRLVQRSARDHFGSMAEELHRSLSEALTRVEAGGRHLHGAARPAGGPAAGAAPAARVATEGDARTAADASEGRAAVTGQAEATRKPCCATAAARLCGRPRRRRP